MAHTNAMRKCVNPEILNPKDFGKAHRGQGVVKTLSEVEVLLRFTELDDVCPILVLRSRSVGVHAQFEVDQSFAESSTGQRKAIEPREEVPGCDVVVESRIEARPRRGRDVQFVR